MGDLFDQVHKAKVMASLTEVKQIGTDGEYMIRYTKYFADAVHIRIYQTSIKATPIPCLQNVTGYFKKAG